MTLKTFTLQKIRKAWRNHKSRLKKQHYIPHSRNKTWVKNNKPPRCITQDWDILVDHWYTNDAVVCLFSLFSIMDHTKRRMIIEKLREYILDCFQIGFVNFMSTFFVKLVYMRSCVLDFIRKDSTKLFDGV